jgi:TPR repeat protein
MDSDNEVSVPHGIKATDLAEKLPKIESLAENGDPKAQFLLGYIYDEELGVDHSCEKTTRWYLLSAMQGNADAQYSIGQKYYQGSCDRPMDWDLAFKWYRNAAEQGHTDAQHQLAYMYWYGHGVTKSEDNSIKMLRAASESGKAESQDSLAGHYLWGFGVEQDFEEAANWYEKAAKAGHIGSQIELGCMYKDGTGLDQDYVMAYSLFYAAALQNSKHGELRDSLKEKMTSDQVAQAETLSGQWCERNDKE